MTTEPTSQPEIPTPPQGGDLLEWIVGQYLGQKIQAKNILNYNGANMAFNHARDIAQKLNLDVNRITPFPANSTSINVSMPDSPPTPTAPQTSTTPATDGMKPWQQAAIAAMLMASGAAVATLIPSLIDGNKETIPVAEPYTPTEGIVDIDVR
jgi:hypothetical protein